MGRLRLRISDSAGEEKLRGALENATRVELEIGAPGTTTVMRIRDTSGALLALVSLTAGAGVELRSSPWQGWTTTRDPVERLVLSIKIHDAPEPQLRTELNHADLLVVEVPLTLDASWEVAVTGGKDPERFHAIQSIFSIAPPGYRGFAPRV